MEPLKSVTGNAKFRVRNTFIGSCEQIQTDRNRYNLLSSNRSKLNENDCAFAGIQLIRSVNYYIIRYYCPTFLMVAISACSFWLPTNAWPARMYLTSSVLLTLTTSSSGAYNEVPADSVISFYWWFWGCQLLVYSTLIEYALALAWVQFALDKNRAKAQQTPSPDGHYFGNDGWYRSCGNCWQQFIRFFFGETDHLHDPVNRNKVDYFARIIFPLIMLLLTLVYIVATIPVWAIKWRW